MASGEFDARAETTCAVRSAVALTVLVMAWSCRSPFGKAGVRRLRTTSPINEGNDANRNSNPKIAGISLDLAVVDFDPAEEGCQSDSDGAEHG